MEPSHRGVLLYAHDVGPYREGEWEREEVNLTGKTTSQPL